ncbi:4-hydroxy-tetrahydrodipicolinate reductase [Flavobacterium sp.]|uniref:4-hydroxy-tetrahydrodipicolinate reductase n=1 Tax=Flavobacterium sp. TaxID=239 RepID=UPI00286C6593|nr:4-hydroxy-tetrahydrodipicolinate reductase [Flavobacterium sp.]
MKIALLGYGKMGKVIEKIALDRGHEIVLRKSSNSTYAGLSNADVAIDFSVPESAVCNISECFDTNVPVVCGTTGWLDHYNEMVSICKEKNGSFIYASNFSLGVNIFFELNDYLAKMMSKIDQYKVSMEEIHHTQKLDAPSGTAISLANGIIKNSTYKNWTLNNPEENEIKIDAKRIENVPGTHSIFYDSNVDQIEIKHTAYNREGFALGAVIAAEWIQNKKGVFTMKDVLNL